MHIVIGKYDGYIRIIGRGFTVYVETLKSFDGIRKLLNVTSVHFDDSIKDDIKLVEQLTMFLQHRD